LTFDNRYATGVASRPARPSLRARYDRRQQEVVVAAARVFAERGYDQTSVPDLARELGLATGSLYHYFGSKEQLLIEICDQLIHPLLERAREPIAQEAPPEQRLRDLVRLWVAHVVEHRDHMLVFQQQRHAIQHGPQWRSVRASRKAFEALVADALAELHSLAEPPEKRRLLIAALLGMVNHTAQWYRPSGSLTAQQIADGYVGLLVGRCDADGASTCPAGE
jgi:TetR/AcrR family transcriptional regulator, cholesterol catabolism regulator